MTAAGFACVLALFLALLLIATAPPIERLGGQSGVTGAIIVALVLLCFVVLIGLFDLSLTCLLAALVAAAMLVWALVGYVRYRGDRSAALAARSAEPTDLASINCRSRLVSGTRRVDGKNKETWRTYLFPLFVTSPSAGALVTKAKAWGGAYYVLYYTTGVIEVTPKVTIVCEEGDSKGKCLGDGSETGTNDDNDPPVRVRVLNAVTSSGPRVRVATVMGAALNAAGGPTVTITPGGIGGTITFPDASLATQAAMGTCRWICDKREHIG